MNYELAKKLKDYGFPSNWMEYVIAPNEEFRRIGLHGEIDPPLEADYIPLPTLKELIVACGPDKGQFNMISTPAGWSCDFKKVFGNAYPDALALNYPTPEEAVANLWLELNKK